MSYKASVIKELPKFCCAPAGQIVTGDLTIIDILSLRKLFQSGPKYREQVKIK